jgi:uncharacterized protein (DUF58 family)
MASSPPLSQVIDAVRGVRWAQRRSVAPGAPGAHRSRRRGTIIEFTEYRPYRQGDEPRRLDWKLLARTDRAYIRLTDDHAVLPTTIVVDASASMAYPVATLAKWWHAAQLALGFVTVAHATGDPVGLTATSVAGAIADIPRTTRRGVIRSATSMLAAIVPGDPARARRSATPPAATRGRWVVISDFLQDDESHIAQARAVLAGRGEVYAVHVVAREELDPPRRATLVNDPEDPAVRRPLIGETRRAYLEAFGAWRDRLRHEWRTAGAQYTMVSTDEPADRVVRRVVRS